MADEATLKDTLVSDAPTEIKPVEAAAGETEEIKAPRILEAPDPAAAKLGTILLNSGWTEDKINDLLQAPAALESLKYTIQNNPQEFLNMVERADPKAGESFLEKMADTYVNRYGDRDQPAGKPDKSGDSELTHELRQLREKTNRLEAQQLQREQAMAQAAMRQRLDARVDDLFGQVKDLGLKPSETKNLKARLYTELASDPTVMQRVSNGNFVDTPRVFQTLIDEVVADKKAVIETEKKSRERAQAGAYPEFTLGAQAIPSDLLEKSSGSWDDTEAALAKALTGAR
jgi:hypothetical protein